MGNVISAASGTTNLTQTQLDGLYQTRVNASSQFNTLNSSIGTLRTDFNNWTGSLGTQRIGCPKCGVASGYTVIAVTVVIGLNVMS
jgi:hypothetical protein